MYVTNYNVMTNAIKAEFVTTKKNLFQAIRGHYDFVNAQVFVFALAMMSYQRTLIGIGL